MKKKKAKPARAEKRKTVLFIRKINQKMCMRGKKINKKRALWPGERVVCGA